MRTTSVLETQDRIAREHWLRQAQFVRENQYDSHEWARSILYFDIIKHDLPTSIVEFAEELCSEPVVESGMLAALLAIRAQCDGGR